MTRPKSSEDLERRATLAARVAWENADKSLREMEVNRKIRVEEALKQEANGGAA